MNLRYKQKYIYQYCCTPLIYHYTAFRNLHFHHNSSWFIIFHAAEVSRLCFSLHCLNLFWCAIANSACFSSISLISCEFRLVSIPSSILSSLPFFNRVFSSATHKHEFICVHMCLCFELARAYFPTMKEIKQTRSWEPELWSRVSHYK